MTEKGQDTNCNRQRIRFKWKLGTTLLLWFLVLSIVPMTVISVINYQSARESIFNSAEKALKSAVKMKREQIHSYFSRMLTALIVQSEMRQNVKLLEDLIIANKDKGKTLAHSTKSSKWTKIIDVQGKDLEDYRKKYDYYDIFLVDSLGNILFSAVNDDDLGSNIFDSKYSNSLFAIACKSTLETGKIAFSDYEFNTPSDNLVSGFVTAVIVDDQGDKIGIIAFQFPIHQIDKIMQSEIGLGMTAETYLVGLDFKMRSNSVFENKKTDLQKVVRTAQVQLWKGEYIGKTEQSIMRGDAFVYDGPHGKRVLGTHSQISVAGVFFAVIAEIRESELYNSAHPLGKYFFMILGVTVVFVVFISITISIRIVRPIHKLTSGAKLIADGQLDYKIEVKSRNEIGKLANSFNDMVINLRQTMEKNETHNWIDTGRVSLNDIMRGVQDLETLGSGITSYLAKYLKAHVGAIYVVDNDNRIKMIGNYAYARPNNYVKEFLPGDGLVGQSVLDKRHIHITNCSDDNVSIHSSLGGVNPRSILIFPLQIDSEVKAVVELGSLSEFSKLDIFFLKQVGEGIAIALDSVATNNRTDAMLKRTQKLVEELRIREEELRNYNKAL